MSDLTGMYDDGTDLDSRLEQASYLLKQAADESGVDLNEFSEDELSDMLGDIAEDDDDDDDGDDDEDDDDYEEGGKMASDLTVADVSLELTKRAAYEGIDLTELDPGDYHELFDKVASEMTDPYYYEESQKLAAQAQSMDELGRIAARGFVDEVNKLAAMEEDDVDYRLGRAQDILLKQAGIKDWASKGWSKAKELGSRAANWERTQHGRLGGVIRGKKRSSGDLAEFGPKNTRMGRIATGGTAAAAGGGGYALHRRGKNKKGRRR